MENKKEMIVLKKYALVLLGFLFFNAVCQAQNTEDSIVLNEISFVHHLMSLNDFNSAVFQMNKLKPTDKLMIDSINYLKGWCLYSTKKLDSSANYFLQVSPASSMYIKSRFFAAYNYSYLGEYTLAESILQHGLPEDSSILQLKNFELAGISLLKRDLPAFESYSKNFTYRFYPIATEEKKLQKYYQKAKEFKPRSPLIASTLSAIVPGLGKVYAGRRGEGVAAFLMTTSMGLVTWENFRKDGIKDPKTIVAGSIFSLFYIGNIWGSWFSVKMRRNEINYYINHQVLFDIQIPLRTFFN